MGSYPHEMSGGQRQRVMIAMALANDPDLLIADEPTTALDVTIQAEILELMAGLQQRLGMGMVFITHDLNIVKRIAHRVYVMRYGEVVEEGETAATLRQSQASLYAGRLLEAEPTGRKAPPPATAPQHSRRHRRDASPSRSAAASSSGPAHRPEGRRPRIGHAAPGADHRHRRRIRLRQVDPGARAACGCCPAKGPSASTAATSPGSTSEAMRPLAQASCRSSCRIPSARSARA